MREAAALQKETDLLADKNSQVMIAPDDNMQFHVERIADAGPPAFRHTTCYGRKALPKSSASAGGDAACLPAIQGRTQGQLDRYLREIKEIPLHERLWAKHQADAQNMLGTGGEGPGRHEDGQNEVGRPTASRSDLVGDVTVAPGQQQGHTA